jgi:Fe-S cluster assembly protein SufD
MSTSTIDTALLERAVARLPADSLSRARKEALARFAETGFPTRHEDWRYTSLAPAIDVSNLWLRQAAAGTVEEGVDEEVQRYADWLASRIDASWIVIANGVVQEESLMRLREAAPGALEARSLASAGESKRLEAAAMAADEPLTRFNTALLRDALHITVHADREIEQPIGLLMIDSAGSASTVSQSRVLIETGKNSRAAFVEYHASLGENSQFANVVTELDIGANAAVDFVRIQDRDAAHFQVGRLHAAMGRDSRLRHAAFDVGGALIRNDIAVDIAEPGVAVELLGLYLAAGRQHIDNHTRVDHRIGPAHSSEEYRGILTDHSRCVFNGKAIVHKGADGTNAQQANHNLLLSAKAEIDTKPELEIYADDVKCSHGATVGQLDKTAMFYLRSRGLSRDQAAQVLTRAFAAGIIAKSPVQAARAHIEDLIDRRLQALVGDVL